jgi:hypothetical protein
MERKWGAQMERKWGARNKIDKFQTTSYTFAPLWSRLKRFFV